MSSRPSSTSEARLDAMVEEATVDCYNEDEQVTGLFTMIEDNLALPFQTTSVSRSSALTTVASGSPVRRDTLRTVVQVTLIVFPLCWGEPVAVASTTAANTSSASS
jgi:hypothetical protein